MGRCRCWRDGAVARTKVSSAGADCCHVVNRRRLPLACVFLDLGLLPALVFTFALSGVLQVGYLAGLMLLCLVNEH